MNRFIVDGTSGDIVKWLRILGFDVDFMKDTNKTTLIAKALSEDKILLSRSSTIDRNNSDNTYYINKEQPMQILIDMKKMGLLKDMKPFRRCIECNDLLKNIKKQKIKGRVPPYIYETHKNFHYCPGCGRIFWRGSHLERMVKTLRNAEIINYNNIFVNDIDNSIPCKD